MALLDLIGGKDAIENAGKMALELKNQLDRIEKKIDDQSEAIGFLIELMQGESDERNDSCDH